MKMTQLCALVATWSLCGSTMASNGHPEPRYDPAPKQLESTAIPTTQSGNPAPQAERSARPAGTLSSAGSPDAQSVRGAAPRSRIRFDATLLVRIGLAALFAFAIGWEREFRRGSEVGDRTFALVSLGAAAFTAVGVENFPATAEKVMAGVVTGVGFLGGGMILREGGVVRGLTTAAAIWATAAIGMLAGVGELLVAGLVTVLVILILELQFIPGIPRLDARRWRAADESSQNERKNDE